MFTILAICKGGGYRYARTDPPHPRRNARGLYPLHRVLMENKIGRLLEPGEIVHHADENRRNDDPSNLVLMRNSEHSKHHAKPLPMEKFKCFHCGSEKTVEERFARSRRSRNKDGLLFCSLSCGARHQQSRGTSARLDGPVHTRNAASSNLAPATK